jgi:hypothetical protein
MDTPQVLFDPTALRKNFRCGIAINKETSLHINLKANAMEICLRLRW